jgi:uncharacterized RDD family membrane protein YckC
MPKPLRFETPENVELQYDAAGMGTRFVAWLVDQVVLWLLLIVVFIGALLAGASFDFALSGKSRSGSQDQATLVFIGLIALVWGLGSILYFAACELLLRGQTIGKRVAKIRVVKADGFRLDAASIWVRNLFRVLDHLPPMWIVPVMSQRGQRTGDMVAGTLVITESLAELSAVRVALVSRPATEAQFRFDHATLKRLSGADFDAIERILERWPILPAQQQEELLLLVTAQVVAKLHVEPPPAEQQLQFLEDLLIAELRRRDRSLI